MNKQQCEARYPDCEGAGELRVDPYRAELYDEVVEMVLCRSCYEDKVYEV
jgi:hypothetical protein